MTVVDLVRACDDHSDSKQFDIDRLCDFGVSNLTSSAKATVVSHLTSSAKMNVVKLFDLVG